MRPPPSPTKPSRRPKARLPPCASWNNNIRFEEDFITLLKADWSLLTQPSRLQKLAETYQADLKLQPVDARQFARVEEIPVRPLDIQAIIGQAFDLPRDGPGTDETKTGAVRQ